MASTEPLLDSTVIDENLASPETVVDSTPVDEDLLQHLDELISPSRNVATVPEFTVDELVIISVVQLGNPSIAEVLEYIIRTFQYYHDLAIHAAMSLRTDGPGPQSMSTFRYAVAAAFKKFDLPLLQTAPGDILVPPLPTMFCTGGELLLHNWAIHSRWKVHPAQALVYLQHKLGYRQDQLDRPFNFMGLPRDVRFLVYEELFAFPDCGIRIGGDRFITWGKSFQAHVITRDLNEDFDHAKWQKHIHPYGVPQAGNKPPSPFEYNPHVLTCRPLNEILGIFLVSRPVYKESMPLFFKKNNFVCESLKSMESFLNRISRNRREMIRHITFFYKGREIMETLSEMRHLKALDIVLNEEDFARDGYGELTRPYSAFTNLIELQWRSPDERRSDVHKIPGMSVLKSMRINDVTFHGNCEVAKEEIQPLMEDPVVPLSDAQWLG